MKKVCVTVSCFNIVVERNIFATALMMRPKVSSCCWSTFVAVAAMKPDPFLPSFPPPTFFYINRSQNRFLRKSSLCRNLEVIFEVKGARLLLSSLLFLLSSLSVLLIQSLEAVPQFEDGLDKEDDPCGHELLADRSDKTSQTCKPNKHRIFFVKIWILGSPGNLGKLVISMFGDLSYSSFPSHYWRSWASKSRGA